MNYRLKIYWSLFTLSATPALLDLMALIGIHIPAFFLWIPVYILGVIPYIFSELVYVLSNGNIPYMAILLLTVVMQILFAYVIAYVAVYGSNREDEMGTIKSRVIAPHKLHLWRYIGLYCMLFVTYVIYFALSDFVA